MNTQMTWAGDFFEKFGLLISAVSLALLLLSVFVDVFLREVIKSPVLWLQEIAVFSYIWLIFAGAAVAVRRDSHYAITVVSQAIRKRFLKKLNRYSVIVVSLVFTMFLLIEGVEFAGMGFVRTSMVSGIPLFYVFVSFPLAGGMMTYFLVERLLKYRGEKPWS